MDAQKILDRAAAMASQVMDQPQQNHGKIPIQPLPMSVGMGQVQMPDGKMGVALMIGTPLGESTYFFGAEEAKKIGEAMIKAATASASGLVVPG